MSDSPTDRTHPASPIQLSQARTVGDTARSNELAVSIQNMGGLLTILMCGSGLALWLKDFTIQQWQAVGTSPVASQATAVSNIAQTTIWDLTLQLLLPLGMLAGIGVASFWLQTGFQFRPERLAPKLNRLGATRWRNQDWSANLMKLLVTIPKLIIGVIFVAFVLWNHRIEIVNLASLTPGKFLSGTIGLLLLISFQVAVLLFVFSLLDYVIEWFAQRRRWQMTDQQMRDEQRMENGDPAVANSRRRRQWELSQNRR